MTYAGELRRAMTWLGEQPDTVFLGQSTRCPGTAMYASFFDVSEARRIELPVFEQTQLGMSVGLSLQGHCVVSSFPRWNFLILAMDQLVNHLDKLPLYSDYRPRVIVRTAVGSVAPLDPGWQHKGDFTDAFRMMLKTVNVVRLDCLEQIFPAYRDAYGSGGSSIIVEVADLMAEGR